MTDSAERDRFYKHARAALRNLQSIDNSMRSYEREGMRPRGNAKKFRAVMKTAKKEISLASKALEAWLATKPAPKQPPARTDNPPAMVVSLGRE